ncbi:hypothetical protein JNUCC1_02666 [Lentibacillus sp. JNUCC-1]|nr:hypothetical protein [Lentibacillus sp. JNUCC-1]
MARRHFRLQRKQKEAELRKQELERLGNLNSLKKMTPIDFEYYISDLFHQMGFDAHVTKATGDGGKDILIYKKDFHAIIECKRYVKQKVTRPHVQKFYSAIIDCKADKGYIITTGEFTAQAISYAIGKSIVLIDGRRLIRIIEDITQGAEQGAHADMILRLT